MSVTTYLADQVCDVIYSRKIKSFGIKKTSTFYWIDKQNSQYALNIGNVAGLPLELHYPAYMAGELGSMLPSKINIKNIREIDGDKEKIIPEMSFILQINKITTESNDSFSSTWSLNYYSDIIYPEKYRNLKLIETNINDHNEANSRAKLFIYLVENKIIDIKDNNNGNGNTIN